MLYYNSNGGAFYYINIEFKYSESVKSWKAIHEHRHTHIVQTNDVLNNDASEIHWMKELYVLSRERFKKRQSVLIAFRAAFVLFLTSSIRHSVEPKR